MLLRIPEIVGNLISSYSTKIRLSKEFYTKYPEFNNHRETVASVIEELENASAFKPMKEILEDAVPKIRRRIESIKGLDKTTVKRPNLDFGQGEL
jgi:N-methylhydantoinase B/oxoprolinase/acetone carboxylase alpha subunit